MVAGAERGDPRPLDLELQGPAGAAPPVAGTAALRRAPGSTAMTTAPTRGRNTARLNAQVSNHSTPPASSCVECRQPAARLPAPPSYLPITWVTSTARPTTPMNSAAAYHCAWPDWR